MARHLLAGLVFFCVMARFATGQEPLVLKKFDGWVGAVTFTSDNSRLAVGTSDGRTGVYDAVTGELVQAIARRDGAISALAHSPKRNWLLCLDHAIPGRAVAFATKSARFYIGGIDGTIDIMGQGGGFERRCHSSWVNGLALSSDDAVLASASSDNTVRLWHAKDLEPLHTFRVKEGEVRSVAFSPDGKLVAAGIRYGVLRVWDVASKKEVASLKAHEGETWAVAFMPDGKLLASGGGDWNKPGEVRLWETATWKERATLKHSGEVLCLAISRDGRRLAAGSWDRTVRIWDLTGIGKPR